MSMIDRILGRDKKAVPTNFDTSGFDGDQLDLEEAA